MSTHTLQAVKAVLEGDVTSFRYPHYTQGFQPTYEMPPPSTIYGHLCGALGRFMTPEELQTAQFGYRFQHQGRFVDYMEHLHFGDPVQPFPFDRELLFRPRLTLYVAGLPGVLDAMRAPYYTSILGRSQDLMSLCSLETVTLEAVTEGELSNTLLPSWTAPLMDAQVTTAVMARYIDERRRTQWQTYTLLQGKARWPTVLEDTDDDYDDDPDDSMMFADAPTLSMWAEAHDASTSSGVRAAVVLHRWLPEGDA